MLADLRRLPLFSGASEVDPTIDEVTFGDFEDRLWDTFGDEFRKSGKRDLASLPDGIKAAIVPHEPLRFLCWWLVKKFDPKKNCNVRPYYLYGFTGTTGDLRRFHRGIESIRRIALKFQLDDLLKGLGVEDAQLRRLSAIALRRGKAMRGDVFDIDAHIKFLLFESMSGQKKVRYEELADAFEGTVEDVRKQMTKVRSALKEHAKRKRRAIL